MLQTCLKCAAQFEITDEDLKFYEKVSPVFNGKKYLIPPPTFCPECREQRRVAFRVERSLYNRKCDLCQKDIISIYSPDKPHKIYCQKCWWSDNWEPKEFGRNYDFNKSFFTQFQELYQTVPQLAIQNDNGVSSENCEYCQDFAFGKNCYLVTGSWYLRDTLYSSHSVQSSEIVDCLEINVNSELVYESIACANVYNSVYLQNCENCSDCYFGYDLKGCKNCFCCFGLRQKNYHILNKPYSKAEYQQKLQAFQRGSYQEFEKTKNFFFDWLKQFPRKDMHLNKCENSTGSFLLHCKNVHGFDVDKGENCKFFYRGDSPQFCYDIHQSGRPQFCYEGVTIDDSYLTLFSTWCWKDKNVLYSDNCHSSSHLFGCCSLKRTKYCILNKEYSRQEYEQLAAQIIEQMQKNKEWGEFFPIQNSPFCYNETVAQEAYPFSKEEALASGFKWQNPNKNDYQKSNCILPDHIQETTDEITKEMLNCVVCGKNYKIIPQELNFYRKMLLPLPRKCYNCRNQDRLNRTTPLKLWTRTCQHCGKSIQTTYAPERPEIVYCEECYLKAVH